MTKSRMNPKVDAYLNKAKKWRKEMENLRRIFLGCQLTEELKWGKPCYTFQKSNIVIIQGFKESCALLFCKGVLLKDTHGILVKAGENTQAARQIRLTNLREIVEMETILKGYIQQAIEVEKAGLEVTYKKITEFKVPEELQKKLDQIPASFPLFFWWWHHGSFNPFPLRICGIHFSTLDSRVLDCLGAEK